MYRSNVDGNNESEFVLEGPRGVSEIGGNNPEVWVNPTRGGRVICLQSEGIILFGIGCSFGTMQGACSVPLLSLGERLTMTADVCCPALGI